MTVHYLIICDGGQVSKAQASYETAAEAEETAHSMSKGVFDSDDVIFELVSVEQE